MRVALPGLIANGQNAHGCTWMETAASQSVSYMCIPVFRDTIVH